MKTKNEQENRMVHRHETKPNEIINTYSPSLTLEKSITLKDIRKLLVPRFEILTEKNGRILKNAQNWLTRKQA